jgi:hypothetical protein
MTRDANIWHFWALQEYGSGDKSREPEGGHPATTRFWVDFGSKLARSNTWDREKKCDDQGRKHLALLGAPRVWIGRQESMTRGWPPGNHPVGRGGGGRLESEKESILVVFCEKRANKFMERNRTKIGKKRRSMKGRFCKDL